LKDAEAAIKLDPSFVKAYIRKALVQQGMKDNTAALETLQKATEADVEKKVSSVRSRMRVKSADEQHTREIEGHMSKVMMEIQSERSTESDEQTYQRAMRDPEVQEIMSDPVM
jgi:stress-induced-phosphoprotein 1